MIKKKSNLGQFYTRNDVWLRPHIEEFIRDVGASVVVDPFAGHGDLLHAVKGIGEWEVAGYDIDPDLCTDMGWTWNDSLDEIPFHDDAIVVTNPPYLAKNSAARNCLGSYNHFSGDNCNFEDLYQIAVQRVLEKYTDSVFIIPETYFQTDLFKAYLHSYTVIEDNPFTDTDCPVCVVCFHKETNFLRLSNNNYKVYKNDAYLFSGFELTDILYQFNSTKANMPITFNDSTGMLGLRAVDGVGHQDKIRFAKPNNLGYDLRKVDESSRSVTLIDVPGYTINKEFIDRANYFLGLLRLVSHDVVLSPFKNNNKLGDRRRRLDYHWARKIIEKTVESLDK